jgi:hypothetical protein
MVKNETAAELGDAANRTRAKIIAALIWFPMHCHSVACGTVNQTQSPTQSTVLEASASKRRRKTSTNARTEPKIAH